MMNLRIVRSSYNFFVLVILQFNYVDDSSDVRVYHKIPLLGTNYFVISYNWVFLLTC
jgi:hypothetical protein